MQTRSVSLVWQDEIWQPQEVCFCQLDCTQRVCQKDDEVAQEPQTDAKADVEVAADQHARLIL